MDIGLLITSLKSGTGVLSAVQRNELLHERIAFIRDQIDELQKAHAATVYELAETLSKVAAEKRMAEDKCMLQALVESSKKDANNKPT